MDNYRERRHNQVWWYRPVIADTKEAEAGGLQFEDLHELQNGFKVRPGNISSPYLKS